jgi:hypothetical protein
MKHKHESHESHVALPAMFLLMDAEPIADPLLGVFVIRSIFRLLKILLLCWPMWLVWGWIWPRPKLGQSPHILVLLLLTLTSAAIGQNGFNPVIDKPIDLQASPTYVYAKGHWVAVDKADKKSELTGPSVSEITCDHAEKACHDVQANIAVMGNKFVISPAVEDYTVQRWNT